jgi:hypothetical protein
MVVGKGEGSTSAKVQKVGKGMDGPSKASYYHGAGF